MLKTLDFFKNIFESEKYNQSLVDRKLQQFIVILDAGHISKCTAFVYSFFLKAYK